MKKIYSSPKTIVLQLKHRPKLLSGSLRMRGKDATGSAMAPDQDIEDFDE